MCSFLRTDKVIPQFESCMYNATRGCDAVVQLEYESWVTQLNTTILQMIQGTAQTTSGGCTQGGWFRAGAAKGGWVGGWVCE